MARKTRSAWSGLALLAVAGCTGQPRDTEASPQSGDPPAEKASPNIGAPCVPTAERDPRFSGFADEEINLETPGPQHRSGDPVCLVNHFRGRTTCPYGQDAMGVPPSGASSCNTTEGAPVTGRPDSQSAARVEPQCIDRRPEQTVFTSCRCANAAGETGDGDDYCACPDALACEPLVMKIGTDPDHLAGSYCVKPGTTYQPGVSCLATCAPDVATCTD